MQASNSLEFGHPDRPKLAEIFIRVVGNCPDQTGTHTKKISDAPKPPESEAIPAFFRRNASEEDVDILEKHGALQELLR